MMVALPSTISIPSALGALLLGLCSWGVPHWVDLPVEGPPMGFGVHVVGKEPWCIDLTMQSCLLLEARLQSVCRSLLRDEKKNELLGLVVTCHNTVCWALAQTIRFVMRVAI